MSKSIVTRTAPSTALDCAPMTWTLPKRLIDLTDEPCPAAEAMREAEGQTRQ